MFFKIFHNTLKTCSCFAVVLTLMVLYCGQDQDFNVFWDTSGALNDPTGDKHTMELEAIVAEGQNFKSTLVASWSSLGLEAVGGR